MLFYAELSAIGHEERMANAAYSKVANTHCFWGDRLFSTIVRVRQMAPLRNRKVDPKQRSLSFYIKGGSLHPSSKASRVEADRTQSVPIAATCPIEASRAWSAPPTGDGLCIYGISMLKLVTK